MRVTSPSGQSSFILVLTVPLDPAHHPTTLVQSGIEALLKVGGHGCCHFWWLPLVINPLFLELNVDA